MFVTRPAVAAALVALCIAAPDPSRADSVTPFFDGFDTLDRADWTVSNGWLNGNWQNCIWKASEVDAVDGILTISLTKQRTYTAKGDKREYVCGEIQSKRTFGYGLYETRMKAAAGRGIVTALFTYTGSGKKAGHHEIDVEVLGRLTGSMQTNFVVDGVMNEQIVELPVRSDEEMINYAIEWTPERLRWFVNGEVVREVTGVVVPSYEHRLYISLWNGGKSMTGWLGKPDDTIERAAMSLDYVAYTPVGQRCLFPSSISCAGGWQSASK